MAEIDGAQIPLNPFNHKANQASLDRHRKSGHIPRPNQNGFGFSNQVFRFERFELGLPVVFFVSGPFGERRQHVRQ